MNTSYRPEATKGQPPCPTVSAHVLIAIGHFGRQVLWEQERLLSGFNFRVLVVRSTPKQGPGSISLVAAAGGVVGSMLTLRLAQEIRWQDKDLTVALCTPFSWEHHRRYVRALYVVSRLQQMGQCDLAVVYTSRMESLSVQGDLLKNMLFRLTRQAASHLIARI